MLVVNCVLYSLRELKVVKLAAALLCSSLIALLSEQVGVCRSDGAQGHS